MLLLATLAFADDAVPTGHIKVETTQEEVVVSVIEAKHTVATSYGTAYGVTTRDVCMAPCEFDMPVGLHEIVVGGTKYRAVAKKIDVRDGSEIVLGAKMGSAGLAGGGVLLFSVAGSLLLTGGLFYAMDSGMGEYRLLDEGTELALIGIGAAGTAGGIGMMVASKSRVDTISSTQGTTSGGSDAGADNGAPSDTVVGVSWSGGF